MMHASNGGRRLHVATRVTGALLALALLVVSLRGIALPHAADAAAVAGLPDWWVGCVPFALLLGCIERSLAREAAP